VDADLCQGHARCQVIAPQVFASDGIGHAVVADPEVPAELEALVRRAVTNCPEDAIVLE
jgi:ferredoxin